MIIGVGGEAGTGKSTVAGMLKEKYGFEEFFFAKNLKEMCKHVFGLSDYQVYEQEGKKSPFVVEEELTSENLKSIDKWIKEQTPRVEINPDALEASLLRHPGRKFPNARQLLQYVGTEICRQTYSMTYHVDVVKEEIDKANPQNAVISDARFANEREAVKSWGGVNALIMLPEDYETEDIGGLEKHGSETEMDPNDFDYVLINDKGDGFKNLERKVDMVYKMILSRKEKEREENTRPIEE